MLLNPVGGVYDEEYLKEVTELDLNGCSNLTSLPSSIRNITQNQLRLADQFTVPSDFDWSQFETHVTIPLYLDYMMRMNKITCIISTLNKYMWRFNPNCYLFKEHGISDVYGLINRRREGGGDMIKHLCSILTSGGKKKRGSGYADQIEKCSVKDERRIELTCLNSLFMNVYGMEMKQHGWYPHLVPTGRRMREVWKDEGKEDSEGRREWEKRWREAGDIMNEEDVSEILVMHFHYIDPDSMKLFIRMITGKTFSLEVKSTDRIETLKQKISDKEGIPPDRQHLLLKDQLLADVRTLQYFGIPNEDTINLLVRVSRHRLPST